MLTASLPDPASTVIYDSRGRAAIQSFGRLGAVLVRVTVFLKSGQELGECDDEEESQMVEEEKPQGRLSPFVWSRVRTEGKEMENNLICL